ncbi:SDR family oxidoreductase [Leptothrix discophora]|uniref:SDR family oxidoreductase n=1 Tax=Leptothrix discophora TaxID=89 RepID=A0ABT9G2H0_LEPDI|nr:SDR family oxidoreductase [Leptothrix discophora]MDP4300611.1 SDR family oxidoreductase [Leptothrix discophora]
MFSSSAFRSISSLTRLYHWPDSRHRGNPSFGRIRQEQERIGQSTAACPLDNRASKRTHGLDMSKQKIWFITGAGRGLGVDLAKAALAAGHAVVATGRDPSKVAAAVGAHQDLLCLALDVTNLDQARAAMDAAVARFGHVDVLVNNAGNFYAGFFEELSLDQVRSQIETLLFGPMNVTRAVLPTLRRQRAGLLVNISSTAGIAGGLYCTAYAAAKFGLEGWTESLAVELAPFGIRTLLVEPGFFRTELLTAESTTFASASIADYADRSQATTDAWRGMSGKQGGDPAKLAAAIVQVAGLDEPPLRLAAGVDAVGVLEAKAKALLAQADAHRALSTSLAFEAA